MAKFNPDVPNMPDPNYLGYSKYIEPPGPDRTASKMIDTISSTIKDGIEVADVAVKGYLRDQVASNVDPLRDAYTSALEAMRNGDRKGGIADPHDQIGPVNENPDQPNLMLGRTNDIPTALQNGVNKATAIAEAQNQGVGHQNDTAYAGALTAVAKQLRAQWPGYRDYIDTEISKVSGIPIANAYIKNMLEDINRTATTNKTEQQKTLTQISQNMDLPKGPEMYEYFQRTGDTNTVNQWLNYNLGIKNMLAMKKSAMEVETADRTLSETRAMDYGRSLINTIATEGFNNFRFTQGDKTASEIQDELIRRQGDPNFSNDQAVAIAGQKYEAYRAQATAQAMAALTKPGADRKTPADRMGGITVARKMVDENIGAFFDATSKLIYSKDFGLANTNQILGDAAVRDEKMKILYNGGPDGIGARARTIAAFNSLAPTYVPFLMAAAQRNGLQGDIKNFINAQSLNAVMQPDLSQNGGRPYTLQQSVDDLTRWGKSAGVATPSGAFKSAVDITTALTDPNQKDPTIKLNALSYFFDPANKGAMAKFQDDTYDPQTKRMIPGRTTVFNQIMSPGVIAEAKKLADSGNPVPLRNMVDWAQNEASSTILRTQIKDMNDSMVDNKYRIGWSNETHSFVIKNHDGSDLTGLHASALNLPYRTVQNMNSVLGNLANLAKATGTNVDAFLFKTMRDGGLDTTQNIDGVSGPMMRAMKAAAGGKPANYPDVPVSKFAPEDKGPTVQEFVKNPAGTKSINLSDTTITGITVDDIPEGMSAKDFIKQLQARKK